MNESKDHKHGRRHAKVWGIASVLLLAGAAAWMLDGRPARDFLKSIAGEWQSEAYGIRLTIDGNLVHADDVTSISRLAAWDARGVVNGAGERRLVFVRAGCQRSISSLSADMLRLHSTCSAADVVLHRSSGAQPAIAAAPAHTPEFSYAVFWQTLAEMYPFCDQHHTDWTAIDKVFRPA